MLENTFILGTASKLITLMGTCKTHIDSSCFHHVVSAKGSKHKNILPLSDHSAKFIYDHAKTKLQQLSTVLICLRIPEITSFDTLSAQKALDASFNTEWFVTIDMLRRSRNLIEHFNPELKPTNYYTKQKKSSKKKIFVIIPHVNKQMLNNAQLVYYNSIIVAIQTFIATITPSIEIGLVFSLSSPDDLENAKAILALIDALRHKRIHKKTFYQESWASRYAPWLLPQKDIEKDQKKIK